MSNAVLDTIGLLENEAGVAKACEVVESWAKSGRTLDLVGLAREVEARCDPADHTRRAWFEAVGDHVEDQLALCPARDAVDAIASLSLEARERSVQAPRTRTSRIRAIASRLGYGQSVESLVESLDRAREQTEHRELFACWMYEVVLRGTSLVDEPSATRFQEALAKAGHPLGGLPLSLRPVEREAPSYMPLYGDKGLTRAIEALTSGTMSVHPSMPPPAARADVHATELLDDATTHRLIEAVRPWTEGKNGRVEARVFEISPALTESSLGRWLLRTLPLDSISAAPRIDVSRAGPHGVFGPLFAAASNGGAYSSGVGGAYGRLAAWTSLGALVGASANADVAEVESLVGPSAFLTFGAPGPWFYDVAWDFGALVLRPDGRSLAVLAATDTE